MADFHGTKGPTPTDILVDGFVSRTFASEDATNFFMLLLRTKYFLHNFGVVFHQGSWFITNNGHLVQGASPGVPHQATPLLDHSIRGTHGTVVPQKRWTPADEVDVRRHVESADLQLPIFFVNRDGGLGFWLPDILRGCDRDLRNANVFASLAGKTTTQIRINVSLALGYYSRRYS